jgi:tetratricopeptide (TPR) repeat protein
MYKQEQVDHFIGRAKEVAVFEHWLTDETAPWIMHIRDATEETQKKGGVGKTWLLRRCVEIASQQRNVAVVMADFFNVMDRDRVFLAEKIVSGFQELYPEWAPVSFIEAIQRYRTQLNQNNPTLGSVESTTVRVSEIASLALAEDLRRLDYHLLKQNKTLLVCLDTYEMIEDDPSIVVLRQLQTFPDTYQFKRMKVLFAGRNHLDWTHPNWQDRESEVLEMALSPFSQQEMLDYVQVESVHVPYNAQVDALYERTEGRPIIIGLAVDVLNNRILTMDELLQISHAEFEKNLVPQVNNLLNPVNWAVLFMAHAYHRFNDEILEWILERIPVSGTLQTVDRQTMAVILPELSFVRRASSGKDFVLHDEMRRLVTLYCWEEQDRDRRIRKDVSRRVIDYYERQMVHGLSEPLRQAYTIEMLYHKLFIDVDKGMGYLYEEYLFAIRFLRTAYARLLLQEAQKLANLLSPSQRYQLLLYEVWLLRIETNYGAALEILQKLRQEAEPAWLKKNEAEILLEEGRSNRELSRLDEATRCFAECLVIEEARNNEFQCAQLLSNLGSIYRDRGQFTAALNYYEQGFALYRKLNEQQKYADLHSYIGVVYRLQGKLEEALLRCKLGWRIRLQLFQKGLISEVLVGFSLNALGIIYLTAGNIAEAERDFHEAHEIFLRENYKQGIALIYNRLGQVQLSKGELGSARSWFERAQELSRDIELEQYINSLNKQGRISSLEQKWIEAVTFFEQAIALARPIPDYYQQTESLIDLAASLAHLDQDASVAEILGEAEEIATRENYQLLLGQIEKNRGEMSYAREAYSDAFLHFVRYCHHMALYNSLEFNVAVQKVIDAMLSMPEGSILTITQAIRAYWTTHDLDEEYPGLLEALQEIEDFMV